MSQCPFWSNSKEKVSCFEDCVFNSPEEENCPFKLYLGSGRVVLRDVINYDFSDESGFSLSQNW